MSQTVWKFPLGREATQEIEVPVGAKIVHAAKQANQRPAIWAIVDSEQKATEKRKILVVGTGWDLNGETEGKQVAHLGTFVHEPYVWHVFEDLTKEEEASDGAGAENGEGVRPSGVEDGA